MLVVMRHSVRVDADEAATWDDRHIRPYDTPISDFGLPLREAAKLRTYGVVAIVSSPFRRCLQTAGVLARALKVDAVTVHDGLGELMHQVEKRGPRASAAAAARGGRGSAAGRYGARAAALSTATFAGHRRRRSTTPSGPVRRRAAARDGEARIARLRARRRRRGLVRRRRRL
ncbi:hypothetical protein M885DRAFT_291509 [Pelagophyceae sp. CCMP2097]|nr:hypothetical protein M885DRAFT_291509 [Pelagophyceae sp. CCMP2097]